MIDKLKIVAWNVRGLGDPLRALTLKIWIRKYHSEVSVLCLQELQATTSTVQFHLNSIITDGQIMLDAGPDGRVGTAIVVPPSVTILAQGSEGGGTLSWVRIETATGPLNIASI
jgi:exonuclease III